jgi:hypothetical protein
MVLSRLVMTGAWRDGTEEESENDEKIVHRIVVVVVVVVVVAVVAGVAGVTGKFKLSGNDKLGTTNVQINNHLLGLRFYLSNQLITL